MYCLVPRHIAKRLGSYTLSRDEETLSRRLVLTLNRCLIFKSWQTLACETKYSKRFSLLET